MNQQTLSALIWSVADLLRGDFKQSEYGRVILPFTVLRRLDCVLAPTKAAALAEHRDKEQAGLLYLVVEKFAHIELGERGKQKGKPQPDSALRDTENVPLFEDVQAWFEREVLPHAPDCQGEPNFPHPWEPKIPHPVQASASSGRTRPAFNFSFSRYELPRMFNVTA